MSEKSAVHATIPDVRDFGRTRTGARGGLGGRFGRKTGGRLGWAHPVDGVQDPKRKFRPTAKRSTFGAVLPREDLTISRRRPWQEPWRSAAVFLCLAVCVVVGMPTGVHGQAAIETCEDWVAGAPVQCGTSFPQGVPWLVYVLRGIPTGRYAIQRNSATFTGTPAVVAGGSPVAHFALSSARRGLLPAEAYTVTLTDQASGQVVAQGRYTLTPQTPREALTVWQGRSGEFAAMGAALAAWRLNDAAKALEQARGVTAAGRWTFGVTFAYSLIYEISMAGRDYPAAIEAVQSLMQARKAAYAARQETLPAQPVEYEWLVRAQVGACRLDAAGATLTEGLQAFPNNRGLVVLTSQIERARPNCP